MAKAKRIVTRRNLDDRLKVVKVRQQDRDVLSFERWQAHKEKHQDLAQQLREYKASANEWQKTFRDLSATTLTRVEFQSEHKALEAKMHGEIEAVKAMYLAIDSRVDLNTEGIKDQATEAKARRSVFTDGRSVALTLAAIIGAVLTVLLLVDRLTPVK